MSLFTLGVVPGSESVSFPTSVVIISDVSSLYASDIHATFVNGLSVFVVAFTLHFITIDSYPFPPSCNEPSVYAGKLVVLSVFLFNDNVLLDVKS